VNACFHWPLKAQRALCCPGWGRPGRLTHAFHHGPDPADDRLQRRVLVKLVLHVEPVAD
jgi:hypothetical protein